MGRLKSAIFDHYLAISQKRRKIEFWLIGLKNQLAKIHNASSLNTSNSPRKLGFIFDEHLTFYDQIKPVPITFVNFAVSGLTLSSTACTIATFIVYSKVNYCNSLYYKLPKSQLSRLQQIQNSLARTVVKASMSCHITPSYEYNFLSLTYKVLTITQPPYLHNLISVQRSRSTRSSSVVTLARPPTSCSKSNRSLLSLCFTLSLESTPFISSSTSFYLVRVSSFLTHPFLHLPRSIHHSAYL